MRSQPEAAANATAADFFTVEVMGLAHKLLAPQEFEKDVIRLRNRCSSSSSSSNAADAAAATAAAAKFAAGTAAAAAPGA